MTTSHSDLGRLWPSPAQALLLKASLLDGEEAVAAFRQWRESVDLEGDLGYPVLRLLPLAYHNLLSFGVDDPLMGRLKGVYRRFWCENQTLFFEMREVLQAFSQSGIEMLFLKGAPLVASYYGNPALRPMSDLDIGFPLEQVPKVFSTMQELGWVPLEKASADGFRFYHAMLFHRNDRQMDVHYHMLRECLSGDADQWFWSDAEPLEFLGVKAWQPAPTSLLFHTIIHGMRWNEEPPIRWIPDSLTILRKRGNEVDWEEMLAFADSQRLTYRLGLGLNYLAEHFAVELPSFVCQHLQNYRPGLKERIANASVLADNRNLYAHPLGKNWVMFADYCALVETSKPFSLFWGFTHYLRYRWRLHSRMEIFPTVCNGLLRRLGLRR